MQGKGMWGDVQAEGAWAPSQASSQIGQCCPRGSGFMNDKRVKGLWDLLLQFRRVTEASHMAGESLHRSPERPRCEAVKAKLG